MLTRRKFVTGALAAGALLKNLPGFAKASQPSTPVNFDVPPHACDCHTHFYEDAKIVPLAPNHLYVPDPVTPAEMASLHRALHIERVVIVTPSVYGPNNNASTLFGMRSQGAKNARGIAVVNDKTPDADFDSMYKQGFRGARIISGVSGPKDPGAARPIFQSAAERFKKHNWHIQMYTNLAVISGLKDLISTSPVPVVFDHFGGLKASLGLHQAGFSDLLDLVRAGHAYVKISAAYRASNEGPDYPDVAPFAKALIEANPDRILWGTDWPHPDAPAPGAKPSDPMPEYKIDDGRLFNQFPIWAPDPAIRKTILVDNPAKLYGF
jgi:predicted TIM-barrel fold metal-dependent hydrolase